MNAILIVEPKRRAFLMANRKQDDPNDNAKETK